MMVGMIWHEGDVEADGGDVFVFGMGVMLGAMMAGMIGTGVDVGGDDGGYVRQVVMLGGMMLTMCWSSGDVKLGCG